MTFRLSICVCSKKSVKRRYTSCHRARRRVCLIVPHVPAINDQLQSANCSDCDPKSEDFLQHGFCIPSPWQTHFTTTHGTLSLVLSHFWRLKISNDYTKDFRAIRSLAIVMHSGINKQVQSFTPSDQRRFGLPRDLIPLMRPCSKFTIVGLLMYHSWP